MPLDGTLWVEGGTPYMVFCHEWCQMKDGRMCYAPLSSDFASFTAPPHGRLVRAILLQGDEPSVFATTQIFSAP